MKSFTVFHKGEVVHHEERPDPFLPFERSVRDIFFGCALAFAFGLAAMFFGTGSW